MRRMPRGVKTLYSKFWKGSRLSSVRMWAAQSLPPGPGSSQRRCPIRLAGLARVCASRMEEM